jgi:hypothetical protein
MQLTGGASSSLSSVGGGGGFSLGGSALVGGPRGNSSPDTISTSLERFRGGICHIQINTHFKLNVLHNTQIPLGWPTFVIFHHPLLLHTALHYTIVIRPSMLHIQVSSINKFTNIRGIFKRFLQFYILEEIGNGIHSASWVQLGSK